MVTSETPSRSVNSLTLICFRFSRILVIRSRLRLRATTYESFLFAHYIESIPLSIIPARNVPGAIKATRAIVPGA
jgi:hypothetical protein